MRNIESSPFKLIAFFLLIVPNPSISQVPDFSKVPNVHKGDSLNITQLIRNGTKITKGKVICWFPTDSLSEEQMNEIAGLLNTGVIAAEKFIKAPLPWQAHQFEKPYTFYFRLDTIVSHASLADFVSISFWRIKTGKAPWLHEVLHEMLSTKTEAWFNPALKEEYYNKEMPLWLFEGLPDYISQQVSRANDLPLFDVFANSYHPNADSLFLEDLKSPNGPYILSYIGTKGIMPELSSKDRRRYAPGFYHGSCSFVKYIADNYGIEILLTGISSFEKEMETIEGFCGKSIASLKKEWLGKMQIAK